MLCDFRIWDRDKKQMGKLKSLIDCKIATYHCYKSTLIKETQDFILLPFTGLKDSVGYKLYEGDIISIHSLNNRLMQMNLKQVEYNEGYFLIKYSNNSYILENILKKPNYKIYKKGNMYENPELVEEVLIKD